MDDPALILAEQAQHCRAWITANADRDIRKDAHQFNALPLAQLSRSCSENPVWSESVGTINTRRSVVSFSTRQSSFDLWASLGHLENLLSDYRRISPRFSFTQLSGEASIAAGNDYRLAVTDTDRLAALNAACGQLGPDLRCGDERIMDVRVVRAGPWGGETGELVIEALENHALAGCGSLWLVAHGESESSLRVTLDAFEISRWAWAPDLMAHHDSGGPASTGCILDWRYLFERLIQDMDGTPEPVEPSSSFDLVVSPDALGTDTQIVEALRSHSGLSSLISQIQDQEPISP